MVGRYVAIDPRTSRSLRSDRPSHSVGRYVATDQATRSVATYQLIYRGPGRYVATALSRTSINGYDPNLCILVLTRAELSKCGTEIFNLFLAPSPSLMSPPAPRS
ncbi:hypothetical protein F2Q69_00041070 [Brassica cretica]|uniref:Uncharacterized protein n=1 Tax=Brassica cretica TaxID=69181 RepID=A0A8S9NKP0_BRACR|nr:hypothetical protein F2Q69_00041070 [Brassica cretica]